MLRASSCLRPRGSGKLVWAEAEEQQQCSRKHTCNGGGYTFGSLVGEGTLAPLWRKSQRRAGQRWKPQWTELRNTWRSALNPRQPRATPWGSYFCIPHCLSACSAGAVQRTTLYQLSLIPACVQLLKQSSKESVWGVPTRAPAG